MADFFEERSYLSRGDAVIVNCDHPCNAMLLNDLELKKYRIGHTFFCYGGLHKSFPVCLNAPSSGYWNIVLAKFGGKVEIKYSIEIKRR